MNINETQQRLNDFFSVYFDPKTTKDVARHPEVAVPILRSAIKKGLPSMARARVYAMALSDAVALQSYGAGKEKETRGELISQPAPERGKTNERRNS